MQRFEVKIYRCIDRNGYNIVLYYEQDGKLFVASPINLEFKEQYIGNSIPPTMFVDDTFPDKLKQNLIDIGKIHSSDEKVIQSKDKHLEDLRKVVDGLLSKI